MTVSQEAQKTIGMKKRTGIKYEILLAVIIVVLILLPQLIGTTTITDESAGLDENGYPTTEKTLADLEAPGTKFGTTTIHEWMDALQKRFPEGEVLNYPHMANVYSALDAGEIDAAMGFPDERKAIAETHPDLALIDEPFAVVNLGFGVQKSEKGKALCAELNRYLNRLRSSGEYEELRRKWEDPDRRSNAMGTYTFSGEKGELRIATGGHWTPMTYFEGETLTGMFIEIMNGFCASAGYTPTYEVASLSAEMVGLASGTYDVSADSVKISEEKKESIYITDPIMEDSYYLYVRREPVKIVVSKASQFFKQIKDSIRRTFITEDRYKMLLSGLCVTIGLALLACVFGTILGGVICFLRMRENPFVSSLASLYIRIFRSIPVVVLLLVFNYIIFRKAPFSAFWVCVITFTIEFSAYCAEIFRGGINAVPAGQARAATALGFGKLQAFRRVVWPQALTHLLPAYSGQFIATVKMTAVAGYISVIDLTKASDIIRSRTYEAFFPLFFTSVVYFGLCTALVALLRLVERRFNSEHRSVRKEIVAAVEAFDPEAEPAQRDETGEGGEEEKTPLIRASHLAKSFGEVKPVRDVSFDVQRGDVISIIGPSGTGKSTLLSLLNHLEKADSGTILFEGQDTCKKGYDENRMREQIGMVFQSFNLFSHLTIVENLMLAQTLLLKRSRKEACERSMQLLHMVGLEDKALSLPSQLSGGQQQRAAIIRAVAMNPKILLFDEPTSALDPTMIGEVLAVIRKLVSEGLTMLIVTHEMRFARDVSNRVFFMDEGTIYEEGTPGEIFDHPKKDKTRRFINHLQVFEMSVPGAGFDSARIFLGIEQFSSHHMFGRRLTNRMLTLAEELCVQTILPKLGAQDELHLVFEVGGEDGTGVDMTITYRGEDSDPVKEADEVSLAIIRNACEKLEYSYDGNLCTVKARFSASENNQSTDKTGF